MDQKADRPPLIFYVDDDGPILEMIEQNRARMGYAALTVNDPKKAPDLAAADPDRFDLVITDVRMPEMRGDRLAGKILVIRPDLPVILCSGSADVEMQKACELGVCGYLQKPVEQARMRMMIREMLSQPPPVVEGRDAGVILWRHRNSAFILSTSRNGVRNGPSFGGFTPERENPRWEKKKTWENALSLMAGW